MRRRMLQFWRGKRSPSASQIKQRAAALGFWVGRRCIKSGKRVYPVTWLDRQGKERTAEFEDLAELPSCIDRLMESGEARRPGEFYVCWSLYHRRHRTYSWIKVTIWEGAPPNASTRQLWHIEGGDPTPYASPQEAVDTVAFLGLELGGLLEFSADVLYIGKDRESIPTASYSPEAVEERVLNWARGSRREGEDGPDIQIGAYLLSMGTHLSEEKIVEVIRKLIAEGRLVCEEGGEKQCLSESEGSRWRRWLTGWWTRGRKLEPDREFVRFAEPGWQCELLTCEDCGGEGVCPSCHGSGWGLGKNGKNGPEGLCPCTDCVGGLVDSEDGEIRSVAGCGKCRGCSGDGKMYQWRQIEPTTQFSSEVSPVVRSDPETP